MFPRSLPAALVIAVAVSLAAAGCSSSSTPSELDPTNSPLQKYMAVMYDNTDQADFDKQAREQEELIAACMSGEGFEYIPVDQNQGTIISSDDGVDRETEEWVASHGYGFTQTPEEIEAQNDEATQYDDPNAPYVESLSMGEQTAYYAVLYGEPTPEEDLNEDGSSEYNWETAGCQGSASHEVQGENVYEDPAHKGVLDAMNDLYNTLQSSPEMKKLDADWATCMADAGFSEFKAKTEAVQSVIDDSNALYEDMDENSTGPTPEELAAVRDTEIEVALADFTCSEKVDYTDTSLASQFELEEQFVIDHKAELDSLIAAYEQGEK
ncbi:MAG: hypothetical protein JWQ43_2727 [Glaciihabitans sp.]|nr:hypothetical protein [Glaciihabitans sp.]